MSETYILTAQDARLLAVKKRCCLVQQFKQENQRNIPELFQKIRDKVDEGMENILKLPLVDCEKEEFNDWLKKERRKIENMLRFYQYDIDDSSVDHILIAW